VTLVKMPAEINIDEPEGYIAEPDDQGGNETPPEHLAIQASPAIVELAEQIYLVFLKSLQPKVTHALGCDTRTVFIGTEQSSLGRYLTDTEPGIHKVILSLAPLDGCVIMRFSAELLFKALDILLASPADAIGARGEPITEIEFHLLRGFFRVFEEVMKETWRSVPGVALTPLPGLSEENFHAYGESHALALKSTLEIGGASGEFDVVIPAFLARLSARFSGSGQGETIPAQARITEVLGSAKVELDAVLSNLTIRIGDLLELGPGQILLTEKGAESGFECLVNKRTGFKGELVSAGDRYGFQLGALAGEADSPTDR
jgi:flagellar motor switch protein FliM